MPCGRLEAQITIPTGGYGGTIDDSGGGGAASWSVAAGTYYLKSLIVALASALDTAASTDTITVTYGGGEGGTGKVTIASTGTASIVWTSSALRDLLGYDANISGTSMVAPNRARSAWLPDCCYNAPNEIFPWTGEPEADARTVETASGLAFSFVGQSKEVTWLEWKAASRARAIQANESIVNESFERFVRDGVWGFASWGRPGGPIRFYPDAGSVNYVEYVVILPKDLRLAHFIDGWAGGPRTCRFERLVAQGAFGRDVLVPTVLTSGFSLSNLAVYTTASITPVASKPLYIDVASTGGTNNVTAVSGCGLTWTEVTPAHNVGNLARVARWRGIGSSPTAGAVTITHGGTVTSCAWVGTQIAGVHTTTLEVQSVNAGTAGSQSSLTTTLAALENGETNGHLCAVVRNRSDSLTRDATFSELGQLASLGESLNLSVQWALGRTSNVSTFASASHSTASVSTEIKSAEL